MNRKWVRITLFVGYCLLSYLAVVVVASSPSRIIVGGALTGCLVAGLLCLVLDYRMFREVRTGALLPGVVALGMWACYASWFLFFAIAIWYYVLLDRVVNLLR